jgi:hypothetical protein
MKGKFLKLSYMEKTDYFHWKQMKNRKVYIFFQLTYMLEFVNVQVKIEQKDNILVQYSEDTKTQTIWKGTNSFIANESPTRNIVNRFSR